MRTVIEIRDKIDQIKNQVKKVKTMNKPHSEEWLRGYWTALCWVIEKDKKSKQ